MTFINIDQFCQPNGLKPPRYENEAATARLASLATTELEFEDMNSYASGLQRLVRCILTTVTVVETENEHDSYVVAVVAHELGTVGHVPKNISTLCH